jgi:hypothetical protein
VVLRLPQVVRFLVGVLRLIHPLRLLDSDEGGMEEQGQGPNGYWYCASSARTHLVGWFEKGKDAGENYLLHCSQCHELHLFVGFPSLYC